MTEHILSLKLMSINKKTVILYQFLLKKYRIFTQKTGICFYTEKGSNFQKNWGQILD